MYKHFFKRGIDFTLSLIALNAAKERLFINMGLFFLIVFLDVSIGVLRGIGKSFFSMLLSIGGVCGLRVLWIFTVFRQLGTLNSLYVSYPISWGVTFVTHTVCFYFAFRAVKRSLPDEEEEQALAY